MDSSTKVEVSVSCTNLKDLDHFSKSDPAVFLYEKTKGKNWEKVGRTEMIENNLNPKFSKNFLLDYYFEEVQRLKFSVYDIDDARHIDDIKRHDLIGEVECTLADIVTAGQQYTRTLREKGASRGKITLVAEEVGDSKFTIHMQLAGSKLDKKDLFGKSDPFVEIMKASEIGSYTTVYRSKPIMKTLDPTWPSFSLPIQKLCSGDWERTLKFTVWDWNKSGDHDYIGACRTILKDICPERGGQIFNLELVNEEKKKKKKYHNSGVLNFVSIKATPLHSFVDYVRGGCQIGLMVAIDFTASNKNPSDPASLHYNDPYRDNSYVTAIKSVGSVLAPYDSDQLIPAYGFGAKIPPNGEVSHCFPLTLDPQRPEVYGVQGILDAYHFAVSKVTLYGPTNFSSFLDCAIQQSLSSVTQESQSYNILLVITDGVISDMDRTIDRIVKASTLPLSVVIVGVGKADFSNMEVLDADDNPLKNKYGEKMSRDIVQFVPLRDFQGAGATDFALGKETLAEIPTQFLSFMRKNKITPNPPPLRKQQTSMFHHQHPQQGVSPYPAESAPYPGSGPGPSYPPYGGGGPGSNPPYPPGSNPPYNPGSAPYPSSNPPGSAPYPGSNPPGSAPYPGSNPPGSAPYPGSTPYSSSTDAPSAPPPSAPNTSGNPSSAAEATGTSAPYPI